MGHQGWLALLLLLSGLRQPLTLLQQLLEIWNKAKGKERDALLWGDEVTRPRFNLAVRRSP